MDTNKPTPDSTPVWSDEEVQEWVSQLRANGTPDSLIYAKVTSRIVADCEAGRRADAATIEQLEEDAHIAETIIQQQNMILEQQYARIEAALTWLAAQPKQGEE